MKLTKFLKTNKNTRRIFGKRELKIIEKQVFGINLTQSEKNRLSRDIRKKFAFIKEVSRFSEEFELKKGAEIKKIVKETKEIILEDKLYSKITRIFLYGSAVENRLSPTSDIDIAIEFTEINSRDATLFRKRILGKVSQKIDIQVYNLLPKKIRNEIDLKRKVIYKK